MFHRLSSEYINRHVGDIRLQYPNDSFFFVIITFHFVCLAIMIITLSSSSSMFLPMLTLLVLISFSMLSIVYLLHALKTWAQVMFNVFNSVFITEEVLRNKFSMRLPGNSRQVQEDEIGDVQEPAKDKTLRIDMNRLSSALKKNIFV
jgi:hypothetical protein